MSTTALLVIAITIAVSVIIAWLISYRTSIPKLPGWLKVVLITLAIAGAALIYWPFQRRATVEVHGKWPTVSGRVTRSEVTDRRSAWPVIEYEYEVAGQHYSGTSNLNFPGFGGRTNRQDAAEKVVSQFAAGDSIIVHYNPQKPNISILKTGPTWDIFGQLGLGITLLILSTIVLTLTLFFASEPPNSIENLNSTLNEPYNGTHRRNRTQKMD